MPHPLTHFEIQKYYQNEPTFNGVYSKDNLTEIKDGSYIINLDEYFDIGTRWVVLYVRNINVTYFDSFRVEHIPKEIKTFFNNKNAKKQIYLKIRHIFKSCNIYSKPEGFCKSKFILSKLILPDFTFDNVNFDLRKRSGFKHILQLLNICLIFK